MLQRLGAALVKFKSVISGTIERTLHDKLSDTISVKEFGAKGDGISDDTAAFNLAVSAMQEGQRLLVPNGLYLVSSIVVDNKRLFTLQIDGSIRCTATKPGAVDEDCRSTHAGKSPAIKVTNCSKFSILGSGLVDGYYRESLFLENCTDFRVSVPLVGSGVNDNLVGVHIRYCKRFSFHNQYVSSLTKKGANYLTHSNQFQVWDSSYFSFIDVTSVDSGMNGIYIGSNCQHFNIDKCKIEGNLGSGIQLAWSSFGKFPSYWSITDNVIVFNVADGLDINNTDGSVTDTNGTVSGNLYMYNGWVGANPNLGAPTPDGSGIGTFIKVNNLNVTNNFTYGSARGGFSLIRCANVFCENNHISNLELGTAGEGIYIQDSTNIRIRNSNITVTDAIYAIKTFGKINRVYIDDNIIHGNIAFADGVYNGSRFNGNYVEAKTQISARLDMSGNTIAVTGDNQNGLQVGASSINLIRNNISSTNFGIVVYSLEHVNVEGNTVSGGNGGIRIDSSSYCKVSLNTSSGVSAPGIHLLNSCNNCEVSMNMAGSNTGNSYLVDSSCTLTHKWGNKVVSSPESWGGTYGINF